MHPVADFPLRNRYLYPATCCQGTRSVLCQIQHANHSPDIPHCEKNNKQTKKTSQNHKIQSHSLQGQHQTPGDTHLMQTSTACLVFGIGRRKLVPFLFWAPDVAPGVRTRSLFTAVCAQLPTPPTTSMLTTGTGQRLKRPPGGQSDTQTAVRGVLRFFCVFCVDGDIISFDGWGSRTDEVTDWLSVSGQWEWDGC